MSNRKEEILKKNFDYGFTGMEENAIFKSMEEYADEKLGQFMLEQKSFTTTTYVPKHILDVYADKKCIELLDFVAKNILSCWYHDEGKFELPLEIGSINSKQLLEKFKQQNNTM